MNLAVSTPGSAPVNTRGTKQQLIYSVRRDAIHRGATPDQVQRLMFGIGRPVYGVHAGVLADKDGNLIASYRITK